MLEIDVNMSPSRDMSVSMICRDPIYGNRCFSARIKQCAFKYAEDIGLAIGVLAASRGLVYGHASEVDDFVHDCSDPTLSKFWAGIKAYVQFFATLDGRNSYAELSPVVAMPGAGNFSEFALRDSVSLGGKKVVVSYSGGKDSEIVANLALDMGAKVTLANVSWSDQEADIYLDREDIFDNQVFPTNEFDKWIGSMAPDYSWFGVHLPWLMFQRLALIAKYGQEADYILTGDELEAHEVIRMTDYPYLTSFGIDFGNSQFGNNWLNQLFLPPHMGTLLYSPLMNCSFLQTFAMAFAGSGIKGGCVNKETAGWCNQCSKCKRYAIMCKVFQQPLPLGLLEVSYAEVCQISDRRFFNATGGDVRGYDKIPDIMMDQMSFIWSRLYPHNTRAPAVYPQDYTKLFDFPWLPVALGKSEEDWILNRLRDPRVAEVLAAASSTRRF